MAPPAVAYEGDRRNADETRDRLRQVIEQYSPSLFEVFRHDPSLLRNDQYLASYPGLAAFLQQHPEVGHNPGYFVGEPQWSRNRDPRTATIDAWKETIEHFTIIGAFGLAAFVLTWLIRTFIDYRRWLRLTRIQTDAHTKLLDRLTSNEDLMAYIQSPSGRRFLESAPIALDGGGSQAGQRPGQPHPDVAPGGRGAGGGRLRVHLRQRPRHRGRRPRPVHHRRPGDCLWRRVLRFGYPGVWPFGASGAPHAAGYPPHRVMAS